MEQLGTLLDRLDARQAAAHEKLSRLKAGALFMTMGTGKTKVALDLCRSRQADYDIVIWIADAGLIADPGYHAEINKWRDGLACPVHFYSVEGVSMSDRLYLEMRELAASRPTFCIVDESLSIKNTDAGRTQRLLSMWNIFRFRLILNGTPLSKGLIDLYAQMQFIHPRILNMTEAQFASRFLTYRQDGWKPWKRWSKPANEAALIETVRPYIFDAELELPVRVESHNVECRLTNEEHAGYEDFKVEYLKSAVTPDFMAVSQAFQARYTLCRDKLERIEAVPDPEHTIVYVKFLKEADAIAARFPRPLVYTGGRKDDVSLMRRGHGPLISTYGTGSKGRNWQRECNRIVFFSQTFDWAQKEHARHRVCRTGQESDVTITDFWLPTGLERVMRMSQEKKQNTAANVKRFIGRHGEMAL